MLQRRPARPVPPPLPGGAGFVAAIATGVAAGLAAGAAGAAGAGPGLVAAVAVAVAVVGTAALAVATTAAGALAAAAVCWGFADGFGLHRLAELHTGARDLELLAGLLGTALVAHLLVPAVARHSAGYPAR
jgi:hypothetical protein